MMAKIVETGAVDNSRHAGLESIAVAARAATGRALPPVQLWNPPYCGDIGLKITRDGVWHYGGTPIGRPALVRLFSTILRKDPEGHMLVTPVEKVFVDVEDAPFVAVEMIVDEGERGRTLRLRTNVDDWFPVDGDHPLRFEAGPSGGVKPYALARGDLWALASRAVFFDLAALGEVRETDAGRQFGVASAGQFFVICPEDELGETHEPR